MPAKVLLLRSLCPQAARDALLARYRKCARSRFGSAVWVGPSREAVDEIRPHLGNIVAPLLFDWHALARHILRLQNNSFVFIPAHQARLLLQESIARLNNGKQLHFLGGVATSRGLLDDLAGLLGQTQETGLTVENLLQAIAEVQLSRGDKKLADVATILRHYQGELQARQLSHPGDAIRLAAVSLDGAGGFPFPNWTDLFVEGCSDWTPPRVALLKQLARNGARVFINQVDESVPGREELFRLQRQSTEALRMAFAEMAIEEIEEAVAPPTGLGTLRRSLFSGASSLPSNDATGVVWIEAPAPLGEARLAARHVRELLGRQINPQQILITVRHLTNHRDLIREVFDEYDIPFDMEGDEPWSRSPLIKVLLGAVRLRLDNWPFAGVTALLRNSLFRPDWANEDEPRHAEALLRMLGEPNGKETVLSAVRVWAQTPPPALEDEQAEESRRRRKIGLAKSVGPFLKKFFETWDRFLTHASPLEYVKAVREFSELFGGGSYEHESTIESFLTEFENWSRIADLKRLNLAAFVRALQDIASGPHRIARSTAGKVRVRAAESAQHLNADYLLLIGLGERIFPDLSPSTTLLDESDCRDLNSAGTRFADPEERLPAEMQLFYRLIALPRRQLVLSYAAVDPKGQPLLPSSFWRVVQASFTSNAVAPVRRRMLLDGYFEDEPISKAEWRVRFAAHLKDGGKAGRHPVLPQRLIQSLQQAALMAKDRFGGKAFGTFDGQMSRTDIIAELNKRFGPDRIFSPTALENYVACPFKFFLANVLKLEVLEEPDEQVQPSSRGSAFHRALSRFHGENLDREYQKQLLENRDAKTSKELQTRLNQAIEEYKSRASTDAGKVLWDLERMRLERNVGLYHDHWAKFAGVWQKKLGHPPAPTYLEVDFGFGTQVNTSENARSALQIESDGVQVRIGGRIDRVDVAQLKDELGFWIIDYKTGKANYYNSADLSGFKKLQLSLYALAVQRVFYQNKARPLGLAYWLLTADGVKSVLPGNTAAKQFLWFDEPDSWDSFSRNLEGWVARLVLHIRRGSFPLAPRENDCTATCSFGQICRISQSRGVGKQFDLPLPNSNRDESELETEPS